jgi:hypothetical protein
VTTHRHPVVALEYAMLRYGAELIAAGARMSAAHVGGIGFAMALDDLRKAHAATGAAIAEYERATREIERGEARRRVSAWQRAPLAEAAE